MLREVVLIGGKQRAGKDTVADMLTQVWYDRIPLLPGYKRIGLADSLKLDYCISKGISLPQLELKKRHDPQLRLELIEYGASKRAEDEDYWVKRLLETEYPLVIVPDVRFPNEIDYFSKIAPVTTTIRVEADREERAKRGTLSNETDASEISLDDFPFDFVIENNGTFEDLYSVVASIGINVLTDSLSFLADHIGDYMRHDEVIFVPDTEFGDPISLLMEDIELMEAIEERHKDEEEPPNAD